MININLSFMKVRRNLLEFSSSIGSTCNGVYLNAAAMIDGNLFGVSKLWFISSMAYKKTD